MLIDFYMYNAHELIVWEPIVRRLLDLGIDARIILEPPGIHTAMGSRPDPTQNYRDDKHDRLEPLMTREAFNEAFYLLSELGLPQLQVGRYRIADAVVTTQGVGWLWRYEEALKLKTAYGCAANHDVYGHSEMNVGLDGVFVQGKESQAAIGRWVDPADVVVTGYPKFSSYLRGEVDVETWDAHFGLDPGRLTIAYFSTWAHNSSLRRFAPAIARLGERFNVLYKPHHNNLHFERERIAPLERAPGVIVQTTVPSNLPFLAVADVVLADVRSGSLTEAFLTEKRAIGLSANGDVAEDNLLDGIEDAAPIVSAPDELEATIDAILDKDSYIGGRLNMSRRLFEPLGGHDDLVTAKAMVRLIERKTNRVAIGAGQA